ncbi:MAG: CdaR family protein [Bacillota bacterium]|nr:CdaR family protein [Bacillota bacterium]
MSMKSLRAKTKQIWQPPHFWGFRFCAVLLAILLWFYVMETQNPTTEESYTVPVEMRDLSSRLAIPDTNRQVTIRVQGNSTLMKELSSRKIFAYCDFSDVEAGEATLPVEVELPEGISLVNVLPESMSFTLEAVESEAFPLEVRVAGSPADSYNSLDPILSPEMVTLSGSKNNLSRVSTVFVSADISEFSENYKKNLSVEVLDSNGNNISEMFSFSPSTVNVLIPIVYEQPEKSVAVSPIYDGEPALGYRISRVVVEPATVRAFGDLDELNKLYYVETSKVDVSELKKTTSFTVNLIHGNNVSLSTNMATVVVQIEPEATVTVKKNLVYYENLAEGLLCTMPNLEMEIHLSGADTYISNLDENQVVPFVDMSLISGPGSYTLPIHVNLPANVSLLSCNPAAVEVTVMEYNGEQPEDPSEQEEQDVSEDAVNEESGETEAKPEEDMD